MPRTDTDLGRNRDDEMKPGSPPRSAHEPRQGEDSSRTPKTQTDPATGEPARGGPPRPSVEGERA
jgi:hypothetical protein